MQERLRNGANGWITLLIIGGALIYSVFNFVTLIQTATSPTLPFFLMIAIFIGSIFCLPGFYIVQPNVSRVLQFFGHYYGTTQTTGLRWTLPIFSKTSVSTRIRNFETHQIKVNDSDGNPVVAAAIIVWKVSNSAAAIFDIDDVSSFVRTQSEAALRTLIMRHPYQSANPDIRSLITHIDEIANALQSECQNRVAPGGVEICEARISHVAYSQEIAAAMLQRQQANAIVDARSRIVEGAIGMVDQALDALQTKEICHFDEKEKSRLASNLLVVLCSETNTQPVVGLDTA